MVTARQLRVLDLGSSPPGSALRHISAASGMVVAGRWLYVVADDELHMGVFELDSMVPGCLVRLLDGSLPCVPQGRKALTPDFEVLLRLPAFSAHPHGALLALPSGSRPNRRIGASLALDASGRISGPPRILDLSPFYVPLQREFPDLNIEGAVIVEEQLVLLQRGGKPRPISALVHLPLARICDAINASGPSVGSTAPDKVHLIELGDVAGVPLALTDGAALPDGRIVFCAVAENTADSYVDGPCLGAAVGVIDQGGQVEFMLRLQPDAKVEGIHAAQGEDRLELMLVTDADDPSVPASLLVAAIPLR